MKFPFRQKVQLQPVPIEDEDDELMQAILQDSQRHDNAWLLDPYADSGEITRFWQKIDTDRDGGV